MTNQCLTLEFGQDRQRFFDRSLRWLRDSSDPKIDDVKTVESEISEIVMDGIDQLLPRKSMKPRLVFAAASANLGDDHEVIRVGMKRLLDELIGHMRTVVVAGIAVVHTRRYHLSQNSNCTVNITRKYPNSRAGEVHRPIAHPVQAQRRIGKCEGATEFRLFCHCVLSHE